MNPMINVKIPSPSPMERAITTMISLSAIKVHRSNICPKVMCNIGRSCLHFENCMNRHMNPQMMAKVPKITPRFPPKPKWPNNAKKIFQHAAWNQVRVNHVYWSDSKWAPTCVVDIYSKMCVFFFQFRGLVDDEKIIRLKTVVHSKFPMTWNIF